MIFVTGGTGTIGSVLLPLLSSRDAPVRALAHSPKSRSRLEASKVEVVQGDLDEPDSYAPALAGCESLFLLSPARPNQLGREVAAIDAARVAGIGHVVAVSILGADAASPSPLTSWHGEIDEHLMESGMSYTILRPSGFMQFHLRPPTVLTEGRWYGMTGDGASSFIDAGDVAAAAAEVLTSPDRESAVYELTGPQAISMPEAAATLARVVGRDIEYVDLPAEVFRRALLSRGLPEAAVDGVVGFYGMIRAGHAATVANGVEQLTGRPARTFEEFVRASQPVAS